jgi:hypothetical protein
MTRPTKIPSQPVTHAIPGWVSSAQKNAPNFDFLFSTKKNQIELDKKMSFFSPKRSCFVNIIIDGPAQN